MWSKEALDRHEVSTTCGSGWVLLLRWKVSPTRYRRWY